MLSLNTTIRERYLITRQIPTTQVSAAYEAFDLQARANIILKQMLVAGDGNEASDLPRRAEVEQAVQTLAGLRYPGLPVVRDSFVEGESIFLAFARVPSDDLATMLKSSGSLFPVDRVLRWGEQLLDALDYIHTLEPPLIHGNITPQNLKLQPDDQIVLLGFRVAKDSTLAAKAIAASSAPATTPFISLEQARGEPASQRDDIYALAATFYYLLTNTLPTPAIERANTIARGQPDPLHAPDTYNSEIPPSVSDVVMRALALDPKQRTASAAVMGAALSLAAKDVRHVPPPEPEPEPKRRWPRHMVVLATIVLALLSFSGVALAAYVFVPLRFQPTPPPATPAAIATTKPTAAALNTPTAGASAPTAPPTARPSPHIASIDPQAVFVGPLPLVLTLQGTGLDQVRVVRLMADSRMPIDTSLQPIDTGQLALSIAALPELLNGEIQYQLEVDGVLLVAPTVSLRDFIERKTMQGVLAEYVYTDRVTSDVVSAYTQMRVDPNVSSPPTGLLRNNDEIEILRDDVGGWYRIRIRSNNDPALIGTTGWVERWLVDNQGVPPSPTPTATPDMPPTPASLLFAGRVYSAPTDAAVQCGTTFESSIYGSIEDASGRGISGARLQIISNDGQNRYTVMTGRDGTYSVPGLGCTIWNVFLIGVPNAPNGFDATVVTVRNLNGGRYTSAEVRFRQQP
jgi:serine/threonine protein kinase